VRAPPSGLIVVRGTLTVAGDPRGSGGGSFSFAGAGAGSGNAIDGTVEAAITGDSTVPATLGAVKLEARDESLIDANAGGVAAALAFGQQGAAGALSIGASAAKNDITREVRSVIDDSTVTGTGSATSARAAAAASPRSAPSSPTRR
jgi:hypothetical protein